MGKSGDMPESETSKCIPENQEGLDGPGSPLRMDFTLTRRKTRSMAQTKAVAENAATDLRSSLNTFANIWKKPSIEKYRR